MRGWAHFIRGNMQDAEADFRKSSRPEETLMQYIAGAKQGHADPTLLRERLKKMRHPEMNYISVLYRYFLKEATEQDVLNAAKTQMKDGDLSCEVHFHLAEAARLRHQLRKAEAQLRKSTRENGCSMEVAFAAEAERKRLPR